MNELFTIENLFFAWEGFRKEKQWKQDVLLFERNLEDNLFPLYEELSTRTYVHQPYERFTTHDPKFRVIHKATVRDRVVHHLVFQMLERLYQPRFLHQSYSCQRGKGIHRAVRDLDTALRKVSSNYREIVWALKMDIQKFFDSVDHEILLTLLRRRVHDDALLWLLERITRSYSSWRGQGKGVPIGNLTSQIFANIYLSELDYFVKHLLGVHWYFRYADDFVLLHEDRTQLEEWSRVIQNFVMVRLALTVHPKKIIVRKFRQGIDFLGYVLRPHYRVLRTRTKRRMFTKMRERIFEYNEGTRDAISLHQSIQSYLGMLQHCAGHRLSHELQNIVWLDNARGTLACKGAPC